jgi:hypothetical protein
MDDANNQIPTIAKIIPLHRLIDWVFIFSVWMNRFCAVPIMMMRVNMRRIIVSAVIVNAEKTAVSPPLATAYPVRPTRIGPVQPNPAKI